MQENRINSRKSEKLSLRGGSIRFYLKAATTANNSKVESESIVYERFNCISELEGKTCGKITRTY